MRKLYIFNMVTLDGFFEGPKGAGDIEWHHTDEEFNQFSIEQLNEIGTLLFGRITYELMSSYWPTEGAINDDPEVANAMNNLPKVVVSRTLDKADWNNSVLIKDNIEEEIQKLKNQPGKDIAVFGSANLASTLIKAGLIDEFRVMINPVVIGGGRPLFENIEGKIELELVKTRTFKNGNVMHYYTRKQ
jgi:dihydrofolate reductase